MKKCPNNHENPDDAVFCRACGMKIDAKMQNEYTPDNFPGIKLYPKSVKRQMFMRKKDKVAFFLVPVICVMCFLYFEGYKYEIIHEIDHEGYYAFAAVLSIMAAITTILVAVGLMRLWRKANYEIAVDYIEDTQLDIHRVAKNCKLGLFNDKTKKLLLFPRYDMIEVSLSSNELYTIKKGGKTGLYSVKRRRVIVPAKFDSIQDIKDGTITVLKDSCVYHYDIFGNRLK